MSVGYLFSLPAPKRMRRVEALLCSVCLIAGSPFGFATAVRAAPAPAGSSSAASVQRSAAASSAPAALSAPAAPAPAANGASQTPQPGPSAGVSPDAYSYRIPLLREGAEQVLTLRGVEDYSGMDFGLRRDERVVAARLDLDFSYSDTLLPSLSHLNVLINSVVGATIPLPQPGSSKSAHVSVNLPVSLLTDFNHLNLQLIAHSKDSETHDDPASPDLWLQARPTSTLQMTVVPAALPPDLAHLPEPFVDQRDVRRIDLKVVLPASPDADRLASAGIVASWLGAQAGYRGAHFTASPGVIPAHGNAVVLALPGEVPGLTVPEANAPTLAILPNPHDANGRLLLVTGHDAAQLRQAATALVMGSQSLSGPVATITTPVKTLARKPYDAPNWLPSDRPVPLGELLPPTDLSVTGFSPGPINVGLRLPPGLFGFDNAGATLDLHYRYTTRPESNNSILRVLAGNTPVETLSLPGDKGESDGHAQLRIPTYLLPPLTTLRFDYRYEAVKPKHNWQDLPGGPLESAIDPSSTIDISNLPRYAAMPDLRAFGDAGFPFTRMADLSDTAVILPDHPASDDYSAFLTLMSSMGQASGYPVLGVTVGNAGQVDAQRDKDLLVLASGDNQPLLKTWHDDLPAGFFGPASGAGSTRPNWWDRLMGDNAPVQSADDLAALYAGGPNDGMIAGFESPMTDGRSVVVVSGKSPSGLDRVVDVLQAHRYLLGRNVNDEISGSLVVEHDGTLHTLNKTQNYYLGALSLPLAIEWFFATHILLLLVATVLGIVLIGLLGGVFLHRRALSRLNLDPSPTSQREEERRGSHV